VSPDAEGHADEAKEGERKKGNKQYSEEVPSCDCREEELLEIRFQRHLTAKHESGGHLLSLWFSP
jgi:hypothetical protein